ncbi:MAG TPA: biotin transporter BioY [Candidatus Limnocylindrales bacterium]|jgi:biotin transport system substrate-specific component
MIATRLARVPPFERGLTLGDFLVPIRLGERAATWQRNLLMIGVAVVLISLSAQVYIVLPDTPVAITGQTFGVLFTAALLGLRRSLVSVALYLLIGFVGLPVFAEGTSGLARVASFEAGLLSLAPTGGYLLGFLIAGGLVGRLAELGWDRRIGGSLAAMLIGNVVIYLIGVPWLMLAAGVGLGRGLELGLWPFVVGDALKLAVAAGLLPVGWWLVRRRSTDL